MNIYHSDVKLIKHIYSLRQYTRMAPNISEGKDDVFFFSKAPEIENSISHAS